MKFISQSSARSKIPSSGATPNPPPTSAIFFFFGIVKPFPNGPRIPTLSPTFISCIFFENFPTAETVILNSPLSILHNPKGFSSIRDSHVITNCPGLKLISLSKTKVLMPSASSTISRISRTVGRVVDNLKYFNLNFLTK